MQALVVILVMTDSLPFIVNFQYFFEFLFAGTQITFVVIYLIVATVVKIQSRNLKPRAEIHLNYKQLQTRIKKEFFSMTLITTLRNLHNIKVGTYRIQNYG